MSRSKDSAAILLKWFCIVWMVALLAHLFINGYDVVVFIAAIGVPLLVIIIEQIAKAVRK